MNFLKNLGKLAYQKLIAPKSTDEDLSRREFILNIILIGSVALLLWSELYLIQVRITDGEKFKGISVILFSIILGVFILLYILSRQGYYKITSYVLIFVYFISISYAAYHWGANTPAALLSFSLLVAISSILINAKFSFFIAAAITVVIISSAYLEHSDIITPARYWINNKIYTLDAIEYSIIIFVITLVSWLSNREIERSLRRARRSEKELKQERDLLEVKVNERAEALQQLQIQRVTELHRLAESGKLASGFFHDLMNPLTALTLAVEQFGSQKHNDKRLLSQQIDKALVASRRVGEFITAISHNNAPATSPELLLLSKELLNVVKLLEYKARKNRTYLKLNEAPNISLVISRTDFHDIVHNLISFAIEASDSSDLGRTITVSLTQSESKVTLEVNYPSINIPTLQYNDGVDTKNLGLMIAKNLTEKLVGEMTIVPQPENQTITLRVDLH